MAGIISALHKLQAIEMDLVEIHLEEQAKQRRIKTHQAELTKIDQKGELIRRELLEVQSSLNQIDLEIQQREATVAKHRQALNEVKSNKDYSAILTTINTEKADTSKIEATALEMIAEIDQLKDRYQQVQQEQQKITDRISKAQQSLQSYLQQVADRLKRLEQSKQKAAQAIPPASLTTFNRVAHRHEGQAMAQVIKLDPRREYYCCDGCNIKVTLEVVNALQTRDELLFCSSCGRILYLDR